MKFTAPSLLAAVLLSLISVVSSAEPGNKASTEAQLESVNTDIEHLKSLLDKLNKERSSAEKQLQATETGMSELRQSIQSIEKRLKEGQAKIKKLQSRQQVLAAKRDSEKDKIADSVQSAYLASRDNRLKLLLNQESPEEVSRHLTYLKYLQQAQLEAIQAFENTLEELEDVHQEQRDTLASLEAERNSLKREQQKLQNARSNRKQLISRINRRYSESDRQLDKLDDQRQELETILAQIASRARAAKPFISVKGKVPWPVEGKVLFSYNERRPETRMRWKGIFIATDTGTKVAAVHDGTVIFSDWLGGYGQLAIVDHGDNYLTLYAHNQWLLKKEGERILAGEALALSGQTGGQSDSGVYFEVRHNGVPQNPMPWLQ